MELRQQTRPARRGFSGVTSVPVSAIAAKCANPDGWQGADWGLQKRNMDKIAGLNEILALDPKNSFARYGVAMERVNRGEMEAALEEFNTLLGNDADYTAGYFMAAQTLAKMGRTEEAKKRLKAGIASAAKSGNYHAQSEMQTMLDELER
jgi:thioredoxin-like negative regulator of GroEL